MANSEGDSSGVWSGERKWAGHEGGRGGGRGSGNGLVEANALQSLFKTPTADYDVLIHLHPALLARYAQAVEPDTDMWESKLRYRNLADPGVFGAEVRVGFDPAEQYARDLQVSLPGFKKDGADGLVASRRHGRLAVGL